jgi:hypothetical protein
MAVTAAIVLRIVLRVIVERALHLMATGMPTANATLVASTKSATGMAATAAIFLKAAI